MICLRTGADTTKFGSPVRNLGAGSIQPAFNLCMERNHFPFPPKQEQVHGLDSWRKSRVQSYGKLAFCCLMGARSKSHVLVCATSQANAVVGRASPLETAERATYSSLRRKTSLGLSGDIPLHARGVREQPRQAVSFFFLICNGGMAPTVPCTLPQRQERA